MSVKFNGGSTDELLYPAVTTIQKEPETAERHHMHAKSVSQSIVGACEKILGASSGMSTLIYVGGEDGGYPP